MTIPGYFEQRQMVMGTDLIAASLQSGEIRGITIDNTSGSWLQLLPTFDLIPPYTVAWAMSFPTATVSISVKFVAGPITLPSTQNGTAPLVRIYRDPIGSSRGSADPGAAFVTNLEQPNRQSLSFAIAASAAAPQTTVINCGVGPTTRVRVFSCGLVDTMQDAGPGVRMKEFLAGQFDFNAVILIATLHINPNRQADQIELNPGIVGALNQNPTFRGFVSGVDAVGVTGYISFGLQ